MSCCRSRLWNRTALQAIEVRYEAGADSADSAYVAAMERVVGQFPGDADAKALLAEAMMMPISWDYFESDGSPKVCLQ